MSDFFWQMLCYWLFIICMWHLYLDESGDLGFDFVNAKPSNYFTITVLVLNGIEANRMLIKAVKKTLARKPNRNRNKKRFIHELKAVSTAIEIKRYFYEQAKNIKWGIYSLTLNKRRLFERLTYDKERVYNFIARKVLDRIPFECSGNTRIQLVVDKCKGKRRIREFDSYIARQLGARIDPRTPLDIYHWGSRESFGLQAVDMFCWGIFNKYENGKMEWFSIFQEKIISDDLYLP